jgi:hypothetical protein
VARKTSYRAAGVFRQPNFIVARAQSGRSVEISASLYVCALARHNHGTYLAANRELEGGMVKRGIAKIIVTRVSVGVPPSRGFSPAGKG